LQRGSLEVEIRRADRNAPGLIKRYQGRFAMKFATLLMPICTMCIFV